MEKRKKFIIDIVYITIIIGMGYLAITYAVPVVMPFVLAFIIATVLQKLTRSISGKLNISHKPVAVVFVLLFYMILAVVIVLAGAKLVAAIGDAATALPGFYRNELVPVVDILIGELDQWSGKWDL